MPLGIQDTDPYAYRDRVAITRTIRVFARRIRPSKLHFAPVSALSAQTWSLTTRTCNLTLGRTCNLRVWLLLLRSLLVPAS